MPRIKRGTLHTKKRKKLLKQAKGFKWGRKNLIRLAKQAVVRAGVHSYRHRRKKKGDFRKLWITRINAALRKNHDMPYSKFMGQMKKKDIQIDRKILAHLALKRPEVFDKIVEEATK